MDFEHGIIGFKDRGEKNYVDENLSNYGTLQLEISLKTMMSVKI